MSFDSKLPSVTKLLGLLSQVQTLKDSGYISDVSTLPNVPIKMMNAKESEVKEIDKRMIVPATGLGIGKEGMRAWISTMDFNKTIVGKTKEAPNKKPFNSKGKHNGTENEYTYLVAPQFEMCEQGGNKRSGYVIDKDFYTEWMEDPCKNQIAKPNKDQPSKSTATKAEQVSSTSKYGDGFDNTVSLPTATSINSPSEGREEDNKSAENNKSPPLPQNYKIVWQDEFDGTTLDMSKWEYEVNCLGGGNNEEQCYVAHDDVLKVQNGQLIMSAIRAPEGYALMPYDKCNADPDSISRGACTNRKNVRSARIHTKAGNGGKWKYGRFEMSAKIPVGNFLWPAFWMLPATYQYGMWAASGEFDIMESRGQKPDEVGHALHYGAPWPNNVYSNLQYVQSDLSKEFMVYGMDWDENSIRFFVNNRYTYQVETKRNWTSPTLQNVNTPYSKPGQPWDQDFIMLLNLAVGGSFFPGAKYNHMEDYKTWSQPFVIDYVRVYQKQSSY